MNILNSTWLLHMIDSSADTPAVRLLSVYSCLNTWLSAPGIRESFAMEYVSDLPMADSCPALSSHLLKLAVMANIPSPDIYVSQMFILLQGAIAEELRNPGTGALLKAQDVAKCIMHNEKPESSNLKQSLLIGSSVVSAIALCFVAVLMQSSATSISHPHEAPIVENPSPFNNQQAMMSPDLMSRMLVLKDNFDTGKCPAPQLINMPPDRVNAYISVVNINFSNNASLDSQRLNSFLSWYENYMAWECKAENNQKIVLGMTK